MAIRLEFKRAGQSYWLCNCDCGNACTVTAGNLRSKHTVSCGCYRKEHTTRKKTIHSMYGSPTYRSWSSMLTRCLNSKNKKFTDYGGRGITVCESWREFSGFISDMGKRPEGTSLGRIDNDGNYDPKNCRWEPAIMQARNKRNTRLFVVDGINATLVEHCNRLGLRHSTIRNRFYSLGWSVNKTFSTPINKKAA